MHRVRLELPGGYPREKPIGHFLTPMFHPNVHPMDGLICLAVGEWFPARTLDQIFLDIGEMIRYDNYASDSAYNGEASVWAAEHHDLLPAHLPSAQKITKQRPTDSEQTLLDDIVLL